MPLDGASHLPASTTTTLALSSQRNRLVSAKNFVEFQCQYSPLQVTLQEPPPIPQEDGHQALVALSPSSRPQPQSRDGPSDSSTPTASSPPSIDPKPPSSSGLAPDEQSPQDLEDDAASQGAFNEETGEINWDCPCLGGMAHGPCGEEFRAAFSCFVYSKEDPKGMDCIDRFKGMQDCFREHPEIYSEELEDEEEEAEVMGAGEDGATVASAMPDDAPGVAAANGARVEGPNVPLHTDSSPKTTSNDVQPTEDKSELEATKNEKRSIYDSEPERGPDTDVQAEGKLERLLPDRTAVKSSAAMGKEVDDLVPKAAHDATDETSNANK